MLDKKISIIFIADTIEKKFHPKMFFKIKINKVALNGYHVYIFIKTNPLEWLLFLMKLYIDIDSLRVF